MIAVLWIAFFALLVFSLSLAFLLLGSLRRLESLTWRIEQIEYKTPHRIGRDGLRPGSRAPDFELESLTGDRVSLRQFAGRNVLLIFTQDGCGPCHHLIGELPHIDHRDFKILVVNYGDRASCIELSEAAPGLDAEFLIQPDVELWKKYEALATPFLFFIDSSGTVASRGIAHTRQQVQFVLEGEGQKLLVPMSAPRNSFSSSTPQEPVVADVS